MTSDGSDNLRFLPVALDVRGQDCLIVGGGSVGARKARTLVRAGAVVTVVSPAVAMELTEPIHAGQIRWVAESFREEHLGRAFLVVAATDDEALNEAIVRAARRSGALVCDASSADRSQLIFGALLDQEDATIAVFTDGRDPALARRTRDRIADLITEQQQSGPDSRTR